MDDVIREFLIESHENLDQLDRDLVTLEKDPGAPDVLAAIFRTVHTLKGTCGFLGFLRLENLTHAGEGLLSRLRDGQIPFNRDVSNLLLALVDAVRQSLAVVESTGNEMTRDDSALIESLKRFQGTVGAARPNASSRIDAAPPVADAQASIVDKSIRVDVALLDKLMNLVGELVLARNQMVQIAGKNSDSEVQSIFQQLNLVTSDLQDGVMKTRMQPIGNIWSKFPRIVQEVAHACGKQVRLDMIGKDTELDKTIIEAIKDPLTHLVRNAVDHGIEPPEDRVARKKPAEGVLFLRAFHEGGQVNIEISDDGGGIDPLAIKETAIKRGIATPEQIAAMTERQVMEMIFLPGFSTAKQVTNVSGRGVGMDVVKTNIEKIGGMVDIQSRLGFGATIRMKIPLTLAIIPALIVSSGGRPFAIPQVNLQELVRLEESEAARLIENIHGAPVYRLRGNLLPLVFLRDALRLPPLKEGVARDNDTNIVVLQAGDRQFGLVVDEIHDKEEIVVKPLTSHLKGIASFAGATILGDGSVVLILDVIGLAQHARVISGVRNEAGAARAVKAEAAVEERETLLLLRATDGGRMAMPLAKVTRLEEIPVSQIERVAGRQMIQYRGAILPLVDVSAILPERRARRRRTDLRESEPPTLLRVIVYGKGDRQVGFVIDQILDIVHEVLDIQRPGNREGVRCSAVIRDRVTEVLDLEAVVRCAEAKAADAASEPPTHG